MGRRRQKGQVLPLFALFLVALFAMAALAIDVSSAYATRRFYRSVADAASLAGAQDLQQVGSRSVNAADQQRARAESLASLKSLLGATADPAGCPTTTDLNDCVLPGTGGLRVSVKTPSPTCLRCDPAHSVQVTVRNPQFSLSFARILGQTSWNVGVTSVAGLTFQSKYALETLQPPKPKPNGSDANLNKDIIVSGNNTLLNILKGDVGTNTSATTTLQGEIRLASGYYIDHYDDLAGVGTTWSQDATGNPAGRQISSLIPDPNYVYPSFGTAASYTTQTSGVVPCTGSDYPTDYSALLSGAVCYAPGIYSDPQGFRIGTGGGTPDVAYLMPGAYRFTTGMTVRGTLAGGLVSDRSGVVLVFPRTQVLDANNAVNVLLNIGSASCATNAGCATPAIDSAGTEIKTDPGGFVITIEVDRDGNCYSATTPIDSPSCDVNHNNTVNLAGNGRLEIAGVIYGPSDNMQIHANQTTQTGRVGQIISWSVTYTGGATLNQAYPGDDDAGVLRLDAACTTPTTACNNP